MSGSVYRAAVTVAVGSSLFLIWANLAVGLIGSEDEPANGMYMAVLAVATIGATLARLRPRGMAFTLFAMATTQTLIAAIAPSHRNATPAGKLCHGDPERQRLLRDALRGSGVALSTSRGKRHGAKNRPVVQGSGHPEASPISALESASAILCVALIWFVPRSRIVQIPVAC